MTKITQNFQKKKEKKVELAQFIFNKCIDDFVFPLIFITQYSDGSKWHSFLFLLLKIEYINMLMHIHKIE